MGLFNKIPAIKFSILNYHSKMKYFLNHLYSKISVLALLLCLIGLIPAQAQVDFKKITYEQAEKTAKEQNKFIFVDVVRANATNDKIQEMKTKVFSNPDIAAFFNEHFINVRMDMGSERGKAFAPKLQMLMYPTMVFFGYGEAQLGSIRIQQAADNTEEFLEMAKEVVKEGKYLAATANSKTDFERNPLFNQLLAKSKEENKPIVLDFYTTWCRPCIQMDRKIFTQDKVASLYNENFILAKYNAEKGEGEDLAKKYEVEAYPDYVFLNAEGKQIHRVGGFTEADDMIAAAKEAIASFQGNEEESAYINFEKQSDGWEKIKQKAIKEGKLVFLDCYAVWCGPCKKMDRTVFHEPGVVDFFDTHFINTKFDMEKGEGVDLKNKFNVQAYPTYLSTRKPKRLYIVL